MIHLYHITITRIGEVIMAVLNIRGFPEDVMRQLKSMAALQGKDLRVLVIEILTAAVKKPEKGGDPNGRKKK
jgi:plasmid stability protein